MYRSKLVKSCLLATFLLAGAHAHAAFSILEPGTTYGGTDGSFEFVALYAAADGQHFLSGHQMTSRNFASGHGKGPRTPTGAKPWHVLVRGILSGPQGEITPGPVNPADNTNIANGMANIAVANPLDLGVLPSGANLQVFPTPGNSTPNHFSADAPVPAAVWLMASGLCMMLGFRRRQDLL